ncbi:hypothetical protein EON62_03925 [archaeon]|nr:MAG: hypothetical protein EON62_03925 [archaeon]
MGADMLDDDDIEMPEDDGVYRPIRRTAMPYDDDPKAAKAARQEERKRQRIAKSSMLADLKSAYADAPMEEGTCTCLPAVRTSYVRSHTHPLTCLYACMSLRADVDGGAMEGMRGRTALDDRLDRVAAERRSFEEDAFTRVQMSKEERKARKARERERARWDNLAGMCDELWVGRGGRGVESVLCVGRERRCLAKDAEKILILHFGFQRTKGRVSQPLPSRWK